MSNYPPGMPGPRSSFGHVECPSCGETAAVTETWELGMTSWSPEECPKCGEPWPDSVELDEYDPNDYEPDDWGEQLDDRLR